LHSRFADPSGFQLCCEKDPGEIKNNSIEKEVPGIPDEMNAAVSLQTCSEGMDMRVKLVYQW